MNPNLLALPIALPLFVAATLLAVSRWGGRRTIDLQRWLAIITLAINLATALFLANHTLSGHRLVLQLGDWPAPFGITIMADGLTAILLTLTGVLALAVLPFAIATIDLHRERMAFYPLYLILVMGVNGAFLTGDFFNLYVFFEVLLMASFVLLTVGGQPAQTNGGIRYVVLNLLGSLIFLAAVAIAYGTLGTLNMAHMAMRLDAAPDTVRTLLAGLLLVAFGSKAALFPIFFWLPSSYHTPPPAITALFGGLLTKVGVYTLFRVFPLFFPALLIDWQPLILSIAGFTMLTGVLGAMAVNSVRRVLSFHVISQVGYMIMGLGVAVSGNQLVIGFGMAAGILYLVHHMIVKTALLLAGGAAELEAGSGSLIQRSLRGLVTTRPVLAVIFFVAAFSLAGIPPSSGFVAKLSLLEITLDSGQWPVAGVSVLVSVFTLMSMARLWQYGFWGETPQETPGIPLLANRTKRWLVLTPIAVLLGFSLSIGIFGERYFQLSSVAARQVLDRDGYIQAVCAAEALNRVGPPAQKGCALQ